MILCSVQIHNCPPKRHILRLLIGWASAAVNGIKTKKAHQKNLAGLWILAQKQPVAYSAASATRRARTAAASLSSTTKLSAQLMQASVML